MFKLQNSLFNYRVSNEFVYLKLKMAFKDKLTLLKNFFLINK